MPGQVSNHYKDRLKRLVKEVGDLCWNGSGVIEKKIIKIKGYNVNYIIPFSIANLISSEVF
jgi:hypothetical protein